MPHRWLVVFTIAGSVCSLRVPGDPPKTLGTFPTTPTSTHLSKDPIVTIHPLFNYYKFHTLDYNDYCDPFWYKQWYAHDYRFEDMPVMDLNLLPVYKSGFTGTDITVAVVGPGGIDGDHKDLKDNYDFSMAFNACWNSVGARLLGDEDTLGTLTAGVIAMRAGNNHCGVGVAYDAKVTGIRWSCKHIGVLADALKRNAGVIHIYTNNWSFPYFTKYSEKLDEAFQFGNKWGRGQKGSIFVFPAGDNGLKGETCAGNVLFNLPFVIGVNGASQTGKALSYGERCSAVVATTYAYENNGKEQGILSTIINDQCETNVTGTWAAGALASGIIALVLNANPDLNYRDIVHIIARSSEVAPLADNPGWQRNGMGFWVSPDFGFGLLNAENMVKLAKNWPSLQILYKSEIDLMPSDKETVGPVTFKMGEMYEIIYDCNTRIHHLENVVLTTSIRFDNREALQIYLTSPSGTNVTILEAQGERKGSDLNDWSFKSVHFWGEDPNGKWTVQIMAKVTPPRLDIWGMPYEFVDNVQLKSLELGLFGTYGFSFDMKVGYYQWRTYAGFWLRNFKNSDPEVDKRVAKSLASLSSRPEGSTLDGYQGVTKHPTYSTDLRPSRYSDQFNDRMWKHQWYALDYRLEVAAVMDLNLVPVYRRGYTGSGVTIGVISDGVDGNHPDLVGNYVEDLSVDVCKHEYEPDNYHGMFGTLTAGVIAMQANNRACGVGVAYEAKVAGIKVCGKSYFYKAVNHKLGSFDIYDIGWAGSSMDPLSNVIEDAINSGKELGRTGKGVIYVMNAGDSRSMGPSCAKYALMNKHGVILVNGASQKGQPLSYGQRCAAILATTYGSDYRDAGIVSTVPGVECSNKYGGLWPSSAFASGMIALILQANPSLTYRDVTHIITMSAEVAPLVDLDDKGNSWFQNKAGFWVNEHFGFGLMNAENMLVLALDWQPVPELKIRRVKGVVRGKKLPDKDEMGLTLNIDIIQKPESVLYLEEVELILTMGYQVRGDLDVKLQSAEGTIAYLLRPDPGDVNSNGLKDWRFKSTHFWGEKVDGTWTISLESAHRGTDGWDVEEFTFMFYGTSKQPSHYKKGPRTYAPFRMANGATSEATPTGRTRTTLGDLMASDTSTQISQ